MKKVILLAVAAAGALAGIAETEISVASENRIFLGPGQVLTPAAQETSETLPVASPSFWFDCADTNGWIFAVDNSGNLGASTIPSKVGTRALTTTLNGSWSKGSTLKAPLFVASCEELGGKPMLDFGNPGSQRGYVFDAWADETLTGNIASNVLLNIGSVFMVLNAAAGGGFFMGAGYGSNGAGHFAAGYLWHRGRDAEALNDVGETLYKYYHAAIRTPGSAYATTYGKLYHDGYVSAPQGLGFKKGWEVVALTPSDIVPQATGIGIGDGRNGPGTISVGGKKIAECIIYDRILTDEERSQVEEYLEHKWFGRTMRGYDERAEVDFVRIYTNSTYGVGVQAAANVPAAKNLTIRKLMGGHGAGAKLEKKGAGTLVLEDTADYHGTVAISAGTVSIPRKPYADLSAGLPDADTIYFHADASAENGVDSATVDEVKYVNVWRNLTGRKARGNPFDLVAYSDSSRPILLENELGDGLNVIAFGPYFGEGKFLQFATNYLDESSLETKYVGRDGLLSMMGTMLCVIKPHDGVNYFWGDTSYSFLIRPAPSYFGSAFLPNNLYETVNKLLTARDGTFRIDGQTLPKDSGYLTPNWQVVAIQYPHGYGARYLGAVSAVSNNKGGFQIAELVIYDHLLEEAELKQAEEYLQTKWIKRTMPGFARRVADMDACDIEAIEASGDGALDLPTANSTVRVRQVTGAGRLEKKGPGTLVIEANSVVTSSFGTVAIDQGAVKVLRADDVSDKDQVAAGASFHVDASNSDSLTFRTVNNVDYVRMWADTRGAQYVNAAAQTDTSYCPYLNTTDTCNGLPVVDFGKYNSAQSMVFAKSVESIRAAYLVVGNLNLGGWFLGSTCMMWDGSNQNLFDFHRGDSATDKYDKLFLNNTTMKMVMNGEIRLDGEVVPYNYQVTDGNYHLLEVHTTAGAHASCFGSDRAGLGGSRSGGMRLGEVILFERPLSEREKVSTRNYLLKKWFGKSDAECADLPAVADANMPKVTGFEAAGTGTFTTEVPMVLTNTTLSGAGDLSIGENISITSPSFAGYTGSLSLGGNLSLAHLAREATYPTEGLKFHLAATEGMETSVMDGVQYVTKWNNLAGEGYAEPMNAETSATLNRVYTGTPARGKPYVAMNGWSWDSHRTNCFCFCTQDGTRAPITGIKTVFWVISGSEKGGGHLLGGGSKDGEQNFARGCAMDGKQPRYGMAGGQFSVAPLLDSAAAANVKAATWHVDGCEVDPCVAGLTSNTWCIVSMQMPAGESTAAQGLAYDGRVLSTYGVSAGAPEVVGWQELAEVMIYDRALSDVERRNTEAYLARKHGFTFYNVGTMEDVSLHLEETATIDCRNSVVTMKALSGSGTIKNGTLSLLNLVCDFQSGDTLTLESTFAVPENMSVTLKNIPALNRKVVSHRLLKAAAWKNLENISTITWAGETPSSDVAVRLVVDSEGYLACRLIPTGTVIFIR